MKNILTLFLLLGLLTSSTYKKELRWMAMGSSSTELSEKPQASKFRMTKGYLQRVVEKLPYIHYKNLGFSGWSVASIADNIEKIGLEKADVYSIFLGSNDWWTKLRIGTIADYQNNTGNKTQFGCYRTVVNKIRSLNPNAKIILITPTQRGDYSDINGKTTIHGTYQANNDGHFLSEYADAIKTIARFEKFDLVDLYYKSGVTPKTAVHFKRLKDPKTGVYKNYKYPEYISIPYDPKTDEYPYPVEAMNMTYDGLHPSDKGHTIIAKMLVKVMKKY